jgi:hypothetical protein
MVSNSKVLGSGHREPYLQKLHTMTGLAQKGGARQLKWWVDRRRTVLTTSSTFEMSPRLVRTRPARTHSASLLPLNLSPCAVSRTWPNQPTGGPERPSGLQAALEERALRILAFPEGKHTPSTSAALLDVLTEENIVVAVAAVEAVAARQPTAPSANALKKLLATVIADARGAIKVLDKTAALTVGKRLHRQAERVRAELDDARSAATAARSRVRATAAADPAARATVRADLAAIDAAEQRALEKPQQEVYVGFSELDELLPLPGDTADVPAATRIERARAETEAAEEAQLDAWEAERFERAVARLPAMPPALTLALGPDGVQALWQCTGEKALFLEESADWCNVSGDCAPLPCLVRHLLSGERSLQAIRAEREQRWAQERLRDELRLAQEDLQTQKDEFEKLQEESREESSQLTDEANELRDALERARGREEALQMVIDRWMGGRAAGTSSGGV